MEDLDRMRGGADERLLCASKAARVRHQTYPTPSSSSSIAEGCIGGSNE